MPIDPVKLKIAIESITEIPTLPTIVGRLSQKIADPSSNAAEIGKLIEQDQALTGKVLRLVNSAFYGFPQKIKSIQHAVVILGFNKVKTTVVTASVFDAFKGRKGTGLDLELFWQHSLATAIASSTVAEALNLTHAVEDSFTSGLMHDIGKVILDQFQPAIYGPIVKYANDKGILLKDAEQEVMGLGHTLIGEWIMEKWRLPPVLVQMVSEHHEPNKNMERRGVATAVHLGDIFARALGIGNGGDKRIPAIDPGIAAAHGLDTAFFDDILVKITEGITKASEFFALISGK